AAADARDLLRHVQRGLPAELREHLRVAFASPIASFVLQHARDRFLVERIEVEARGRVEVRRYRLGIAVHHDRRDAQLAQARRGLHAAAVELDALADADRTAADDHRLLTEERRRLVLLLERGR